MDALAERGITGTEIGPAIAQRFGPAGRFMISDEHLKLKALQDDWIRAKLRKESGAVIGAEEMEDERATYFPAPGDGPETIAIKKRARDEATKGMVAESGGAYKALFEEMTPEERAAPAKPEKKKTKKERELPKIVTETRTLPDGRTMVRYSDGTLGFM